MSTRPQVFESETDHLSCGRGSTLCLAGGDYGGYAQRHSIKKHSVGQMQAAGLSWISSLDNAVRLLAKINLKSYSEALPF